MTSWNAATEKSPLTLQLLLPFQGPLQRTFIRVTDTPAAEKLAKSFIMTVLPVESTKDMVLKESVRLFRNISSAIYHASIEAPPLPMPRMFSQNPPRASLISTSRK